MTSLDDLDFMHFQVPIPAAKSSKPGSLSRNIQRWVEDDEDWKSRGRGSDVTDRKIVTDRFLKLLQLLGLGQAVPWPDSERDKFERLVGHGQMFAGPVLEISQGQRSRIPKGRSLWVSWDVERTEDGIAFPMTGLRLALDKLSEFAASRSDHAPDDPRLKVNIEYLICREVGNSRLRGKGKLSVPDDFMAAVIADGVPTPWREIAKKIEELWKTEMDPLSAPGHSVSVASHEYWLARV